MGILSKIQFIRNNGEIGYAYQVKLWDGEILQAEYLSELFIDGDDAEKIAESVRWPNGNLCPRCNSENFYFLKGKIKTHRYRCKGCAYKYNVYSGTIFSSMKLPLLMYLTIYSLTADGKSTCAIAREFELMQMTVWKIANDILEIKQQLKDLNEVEMLQILMSYKVPQRVYKLRVA